LWPPDPAAIEQILSMRPDFTTRNWHPGESIPDLIAENLAHGLVDPVVDMLEAAGGQLRWIESADRPRLPAVTEDPALEDSPKVIQ
jgi:hypothetical protein